MPNRLLQWNEINNVGNPTKLTEVNDLVKKIELKRRHLNNGEYHSIIQSKIN